MIASAHGLNVFNGLQEKQDKRAPTIHEMRVGDSYVYFARIGGNWVDLAPRGNRLPEGVGQSS